MNATWTNDEEAWIRGVEQDILRRQMRKEIVMRYGAVRSDWQCECGSKLKWNSEYHKAKHNATQKHQSFIRRLRQTPMKTGPQQPRPLPHA